MPQFRLRLPMVLVGLSILAFYLVLTALSGFALLTLWQFRPDPVTAAIVGVTLSLVLGYASFRFGTVQLLSQLDARDLESEDSPAVYRMLDYLAEEMDIKTPTLKIAKFTAPNALALDPMGQDVVVLDASLFRLLSADEFEALLAHELAHLERKDGLVQTLIASTLQTFVGIGYFFISPLTFLTTGTALAIAWIRGTPTAWQRTIPGRVRLRLDILVGVFGFGLTILVRSQSRKREFAADARAAEVTKNPLALAIALQKLERASRPEFGFSPLWVYGEVEAENRVSELLSTHPSTDERVARLEAIEQESWEKIEVR